MVLVPEALAQNPQQAAQETPAEPPVDKLKKFKRNIFINEGVQGPNVQAEGRRRGRRNEGTATKEYVEFSDDLRNVYRRFLDNHVTSLSKLQNMPDPANPSQTLYEAVMTNPNHVMDRELMQLLGTEVVDMRGRTLDVVVSEEKIDKFLEKPEGWIIANQLMEYHTAMKLFALGLHAANIPPGERQRMANPMTIRLGINQGALNRFRHEVLDPRAVGFIGLLATSTAFSAAAGFTQYGPIGGIVGAAIPPALIGFAGAVRSWQRDGLVIDLRQCSGAFQAINSNVYEREYAKAVMGIDTRDFQDLGNNRIVPSTRISETSRAAIEDLEVEVLKGIYARQEFYTSLEIPPNRLDALPEQFLYWATTGEREKTGARWEDEVNREFRPNGFGIQDGSHNTRQILLPPPPDNWVDNPAYDPIANGIDYSGNIGRNMMARRKVLLRHITHFAQKELAERGPKRALTTDEEKSIGNSLTVIGERRKQRGKDGTLKSAREEEINKQKATLTDDKGMLDTERTAIETYNTSLAQLRKEREEAQRNLNRELTTTLGGFYATPDVALTALRAATTSDTDVVINGVVVGSPYRRMNTLNAAMHGRIADIPTANPRHIPVGGPPEPDESYNARLKKAREEIEEDINSQKQGVRHDVELINKVIERIEKAREATQKTTPENLGDNNASIREITQTVNKLNREFTTITGWGVAGLSDADLRTQPIEELLRRINAAHAAGLAAVLPIARGWPERQNNLPEVRARVLHAKTEAIARHAQPQISAPPAEFTTLTSPPHNLSENELRTISPDQIHTRTAGAVPPADIQTAITVANNRLQARFNALSDVLDDINEQIREQEGALGAIDFSQEDTQLAASEDILNRFGTVQELAWDMIAYRNEYTDITPVAAADRGYTEPERNLAAPRGYYEILNAFSDYRIKTDRAGYFRGTQALLPPDRLATLLNTHLNLGIGAPNINTVLTEMRTRMDPANGQISSLELRRANRAIIKEIERDALAIAA